MLCKKCNGNIILKDGNFLCENCGNKFLIQDYYEDIETFICCVENDLTGCRTRDSIIAQEIYQKAESHNIKSFYPHVSVGDLSGQYYEQAVFAAMSRAKVIVLVGTSRENFEIMDNLYSEIYKEKTIIPVFSKVDPKDISNNISKIQALNYDKIGSDIDLINGLFHVLGRDDEIKHKKEEKSKTIRNIGIIIISIIMFGVACLVCFLIKHKTNTPPVIQDMDNSTQNTNDKIDEGDYNQAITYVESGMYVEAIPLFSKLSGYRDSDKQLERIYNKYTGYYQDVKKGINAYVQIVDGKYAEIEIEYLKDNECITIKENSTIELNKISAYYNDSEGNQGNIDIEITNSGLKWVIKTESRDSSFYIQDIELVFDINEKSDKPFTAAITLDKLVDIINKKTSVSEIKRMGYSVTRKKTINDSEFGIRLYDIFQIENTSVELMVFYYDISTGEDLLSMSIMNEGKNSEEDAIVFAVLAPAELVLPEYIGKENTPFVEEDILYVPDGCLDDEYSPGFDFGKHYELKSISTNTPVCATSRSVSGQVNFERLVEGYCDPNGYYRKEYEDELYIEDDVEDEVGNVEDVPDEEEYEYETPNEFCPMCGTGFFITGIGTDGLFCECGCNWLPMCYVCWHEKSWKGKILPYEC